MKALAIAGTSLRRLVRERANVFFLLILPLAIILLLGAAFGQGSARLGVVLGGKGPAANELVALLDRTPGLDVRRYGDEDALRHAVERSGVPAGLVVPAGYDATLRDGGTATLRFLARPGTDAPELRTAVVAAASRLSARLRAQRALVDAHLADVGRAATFVARAAAAVPPVRVLTATPDGNPYPTTFGRYDDGAATQLLLFVFLTSLTGSVALIETRRLGIARRMLASPTPLRTILAGETLGRVSVAGVQALVIVVASALLFGVSFGDPAGAAAVIVAFCLVGAAAGMLLGSVVSKPQQAAPLALLLGLTLAALGGSMVPLELFSPTLSTIAHLTPHAWGNDAFSELIRHDGTLRDVLPDVAVLLGYAVVLLALATWRLRRALTA